MEILFCSNNNYVQHMGICILSLLKTQKETNKLTFHIFHSDISESSKNKINSLKSIRGFEIYYYTGDVEEILDFTKGMC